MILVFSGEDLLNMLLSAYYLCQLTVQEDKRVYLATKWTTIRYKTGL